MSQKNLPRPEEKFGQYFQALPVLTETDRREAHFIRHDVYARDLGYESVRADQQERDAYDDHSLHCILRTADDNVRPVGCVRLVLTDPADRQAALPFEITCKDTIDRSILDPAKLPRHRIGEVSRLAVMGEFRRRKGEQVQATSLSANDRGGLPTPRFPNIPLSLYFASVVLAQREGVEYLFTLTEPRLAKHFAMLGAKIQPIGGAVEHRGLRVPSVTYVPGVYPSLRPLVRPIWNEVEAQIETAYAMHNASRSERLPDSAFEPVSSFGAVGA